MKLTHSLWLFLLCFACGGGEGGEDTSSPEPEVDAALGDMGVEVDAEVLTPTLAAAPTTLFVPTVEAGQSIQLRFELIAGVAPTEISNVSLTLSGASSRLLYKGIFQIGIDAEGIDRFSYPVVIDPTAKLPMMLEVTPEDGAMVSGRLDIAGDFEGGVLVIPIEQGAAGAQLQLSSSSIDFGRVAENTLKSETITMSNSGGTILTIQNILLRSFGRDFSVQINGENAIENEAAFLDPDGDGMPGIAPGGSAEVEVTYAPISEGADDATLTIRSDSVSDPEQEVEIQANQNYSCLEVSPETMRCEGELQQLTVCDTDIVISNCDEAEPLIIDEIRMNASTDSFFIDEDSLPTMPHVLPVGESLPIEIRYLPGVARSNHRGNLLIHANDLENPSRNIQLTGFTPCNSTDECPVEYECVDPDGDGVSECVFSMMPGGEGEMPQ